MTERIRCPKCDQVFTGILRFFYRNKHMREEHGKG